MARQVQDETIILNLASGDSAASGSPINVSDFRHAIVSVAFTGFTGTIKFQASAKTTKPTFSSAQSATNEWEYVQIIDLEDGASIDGDTGVAVTTSTDVRLFEINTNLISWLCVTATAKTAGAVKVTARASEN